MMIRMVLALILFSFPVYAASAPTCPKQVSTATGFAQVFNSHEKCDLKVKGLVGRILRGKSESDFLSLSDNPDRRLIFLLGSDGLAKIVGLPTRAILQQIGYPNSYIDELEKQKTRFKIVVFKATEEQPLADWDHTIALTEQVYPSVAAKLKAQVSNLKNHSFEKIEALGPEKISDISKAGPASANFIDLKKLEARTGTEWEVRAFLFNVVYLNELYSGSGKSRSETGAETSREYLSKNTEIAKLKDSIVIDLPR